MATREGGEGREREEKGRGMERKGRRKKEINGERGMRGERKGGIRWRDREGESKGEMERG